MQSLQRALWQLCILHFSFCTLLGCSHVPNQWREDGPSVDAKLESPSESDIRANHEPAELRHRDWEAATVSPESGMVTHWPLYFEDPFEDKGHGRSDYRLGWEDYVAMPYCYARYTLNWLMFPASAVITPGWMLMESDGVLSEQPLGYDHDAAPAHPAAPPAKEQPDAAATAPEAAETAAPPEQPSDN